MKENLYKKLVSSTLRRWADQVEAGTCEMAEEEMVDLMSNIAVEEMSKEKAARYLNMRRSNFDTKIANGEAPKGKKLSGFKELRWYRPALDAAVALMHRHKKK